MGILDSDDPIFPLVNRRAPVLERFRNGDGGDVGGRLGEFMGKLLLEPDQEEREEIAEAQAESFRRTLASTLGVEEEQINDAVVTDLENLLGRASKGELVEELEEEEGEVEEEPSFET